ncbi:HK97 family phage prohead protease [Bradyrhizobium sp. CIR18]|nr:HK97 family phage prohead protease [Bradyrhizobium sp. CIR18]MBB4364242.1 HK97 family phage prohead protease [Bradyrhizobium sp. CIR18]
MADNVITGFAVVFGDETLIGGEFRERIARGAFTRTLKERPDVVMLLDHDSGRVLGRTAAKTLWLQENSAGLYFSLTIDPTTPEGQTALGRLAGKIAAAAASDFECVQRNGTMVATDCRSEPLQMLICSS